MSAETSLLLNVASPQRGPDHERRIRDLLEGGLDWTVLTEWAAWHQVAPQLHDALHRSAPELVPGGYLDALREYVQDLKNQSRRSVSVLAEVLHALTEGGVEPLVFKGPVIAADVYPDPSDRLYRDIDLLVREREVEWATNCLERLDFIGRPDLPPAQARGFRDYAGQYQLRRPTGDVVEIHWALIQPVFAMDLDHEGLWNRTRTVTVDGNPLPTFSVEDTWLHLCAHGGKEHFVRLKWVVDIAHFLARYADADWAAILAYAERRGMRRLMLLAVEVAREFLGAPMPGALEGPIGRDGALPELVDRVGHRLTEARDHAPDNWSLSRFRWLSRERARDRAVYVFRTLFTPWDWHYGLITLPRWLFWLYYPIRVVTDYVMLPVWIFIKRVGGKRG